MVIGDGVREKFLNNVFYCRELLKQENIQRGDRVAYKGDNSLEWISWNIACNSILGVGSDVWKSKYGLLQSCSK